MSSSTQLARTTGMDLAHPARYAFDSDQIAAIRRSVARDCDDAEFVMFLELVGRYGLDPFAKHIYAAKMGTNDGRPGGVTIIISRDGLLSLANRSIDFRGMTGDVVRKGDKLQRREDGAFLHTYEGLADERDELPIIGAWAKVQREGREATFFYAPMKEYRKSNKVWNSYPSAMILKVAEAMALRKAFSIAGVVSEDEVGTSYDPAHGTVLPSGDSGEFVDQEPDYGTDPELAARLKRAFEVANELREGAFLPQKVRLTMAGKSDLQRQVILNDLTQFVLRNGGTVDMLTPPEEESAQSEDEPIEEAEVVEATG